jgi:hypothetical protein
MTQMMNYFINALNQSNRLTHNNQSEQLSQHNIPAVVSPQPPQSQQPAQPTMNLNAETQQQKSTANTVTDIESASENKENNDIVDEPATPVQLTPMQHKKRTRPNSTPNHNNAKTSNRKIQHSKASIKKVKTTFAAKSSTVVNTVNDIVLQQVDMNSQIEDDSPNKKTSSARQIARLLPPSQPTDSTIQPTETINSTNHIDHPSNQHTTIQTQEHVTSQEIRPQANTNTESTAITPDQVINE